MPAVIFGKKICSWCVQHEAQQSGELPEDAVQKVMPTPWSQTGVGTGPNMVTQLLLAVNVMVFVAMVVAGMSITDPTTKDLIRWGANAPSLTLADQWWRLISYMFLHGGVIHLGLNMWCLWSLGGLAESLYGHETFLLVYLLSGVGGGVASAFWHPFGVSVGASGAIFGIAGALIASFKLGEFSLPGGMIQAQMRSVVIFAGYNLVFGAMSGRTDNAAHMGGLLSGLVLGALIAKIAPERDQFFSRMGVLMLGAALVVGSGYWLRHSREYVVHYQRGSTLLGEGKFDNGIVELEKAVSMKPDNTMARIELAYAYQVKSEFSKSEAELKRVLEQDPKQEMALYSLGSLYLEQKRNSEAKTVFTRLLTLNPRNANAHYGLAQVAAFGDSDCETALREYKAVAQLEDDFDPSYAMAQCYTKVKRYDDAIAALQQVKAQSSDSMEVEAALADAYRGKGMQKEADEAAKRAEELKGKQ
jgi:membrane associated rhomboid family serine protease